MSEVDGNETLNSGGANVDLSTYKGRAGFALRWLKEIDLVKNSKAQRNFERIGEKIVKTYRNSDAMSSTAAANGTPSRVMFNVLWSNVQILKPSLFCRIPKVVVERRFKDTDPVGRLASTVAERATTFMVSTQQDRFMYAVKAAVEDRLLPGRGQVWLRYDAQFQEGDPGTVSGEGSQSGEGDDVQIMPNTERVIIDPLNWLDYFESAARNPYEIRWKARRVYMTRSQLKKRFGEEIGKAVKLMADTAGVKKKKMSLEEEQFFMQAEVFEIHDFEGKQVVWISEGYKDGPLDVKPDTLKLAGFFPCPVPLLATTTTDSMYPTPDYKIYERLGDEVDYVTKRLSALVDCIRFVGATASQFNKDIKNMLKLEDGQLWPIDAWATFVEKGGFKGIMDWLPFDTAIAAIGPLTEYRNSLLSEIDLITGIPDIARGSTDPNETADAQQRKSKWAVLKLQDKQQDVQRFCREILAKIAEIIFEPGLFLDETIALMVGVAQMPPEDQQLFPQALELLRSDILRTFRVDIETDSTIAIDEEVDQAARMEYMQAVGQMMTAIQSAMQFRPETVKPMIDTALFAVRGFRTGKPLEAAWERCMQEIEDNDAAAAANPQPPPPDPALIKAQADAQAAQARVQVEQMKAQTVAIQAQAEQAKAGYEQQLAFAEQQRKVQADQAKFMIDSRKNQIELMKLDQKKQLDGILVQMDAFKEQFNQQIEAQLVEMQRVRMAFEVKERTDEEIRLAREQQVEAHRAVTERIDALTNRVMVDNEKTTGMMQALMSNKEKEPQAPPSPPIVNVHLPSSNRRIEYGPDGKISGIRSGDDE